MDDFRAALGTILDAVSRDAARRTDTTDGPAREAFATLRAVNLVLGQANVARARSADSRSG
jgi:hypothetical protein